MKNFLILKSVLTLIRGTVKLNGSIVLFVSLKAEANSTLATSHLFFGRNDNP